MPSAGRAQFATADGSDPGRAKSATGCARGVPALRPPGAGASRASEGTSGAAAAGVRCRAAVPGGALPAGPDRVAGSRDSPTASAGSAARAGRAGAVKSVAGTSGGAGRSAAPRPAGWAPDGTSRAGVLAPGPPADRVSPPVNAAAGARCPVRASPCAEATALTAGSASRRDASGRPGTTGTGPRVSCAGPAGRSCPREDPPSPSEGAAPRRPASGIPAARSRS